MNEIWKNIKDYPNYQISSMGIVKSLNYNKTSKEKILKPHKNNSGYLLVGLHKNGKSKHYLIHRLVAETFLPNPENKPCIDHINCNTSDNRLCNLRWCTPKENSNNPITKDKMSKNAYLKNIYGAEHPNSKPILQFTLDGKLVRKWDCAWDAQRELGIDNGNINRCCKGKRKSSGGYFWRYYYKGIWMKNHIPLKDKKVV